MGWGVGWLNPSGIVTDASIIHAAELANVILFPPILVSISYSGLHYGPIGGADVCVINNNTCARLLPDALRW